MLKAQKNNKRGKGMREKQIRVALAYAGLSQAEAARRMGVTPSWLQKKLARCTWTDDELERLASAIGARYTARFDFPDGFQVIQGRTRSPLDPHGT